MHYFWYIWYNGYFSQQETEGWIWKPHIWHVPGNPDWQWMHFKKILTISPFSSIHLRQKERCPLLDESEASSHKTEKKITLFNFACDGVCHKITTAVQKIILSCFGDIGSLPLQFFEWSSRSLLPWCTAKFKSTTKLPTPAWVDSSPTSAWYWESSLWPLSGITIHPAVLRWSMIDSKILLIFLVCSLSWTTWTLTVTTFPVISFKKLE